MSGNMMNDAAEINALLAGVPMPLIAIASDARVLAGNALARAVFGIDTGRHYGFSLRQPELVNAIERALQGGAGSSVRLIKGAASGDQAFDITVTPYSGGVICAFNDITAIERTDQMRRDFVANVSHELRTPLTALLGFIQTLRGAAKDDAAARVRFLAIMEREAERMNRLVHDLLQLSRVEGQEHKPPTEDVVISALVAQVFSSLRPVAEARNVTLRLEAPTESAPMRGDADQLVQVLTNLVENAVKYGSKAGDTVHVRVSEVQGPRVREVHVAVQDMGEGIDTVHLPRLTERFYRVDGHRSREEGGTGLGLAIVKHIVNRHKGRLLIDSEKGKGSVFKVILPIL